MAERRTRVVNMRVSGATVDQIAQQLGLTKSQVSHDLERTLKSRTAELGSAVENLRSLEAEKLDAMERVAWKVLAKPHYAVSATGNVARHPETKEVLIDDGPTLQAISSLLRIQERRAKLLGLDQPTRSSVEVTTIDSATASAEIARVFSQLVQGRPGPAASYPEVRPLEIEGETGPATPGGELEDGVS
jgi:predicted transcriptional regulator